MKHFKLLLFAFMTLFIFAYFQCSETSPSSDTQAQMLVKKQQILDLIQNASCDDSGCSSIAFGTKPCGGPWEYLIYSNTIDADLLTAWVNEYNALNELWNAQTNAVSDCAMVMPPNALTCTNGACVIAE
jgi:hypothetical protein